MFSLRSEPSPRPDDLYGALRDITLRPFKTLKPPWSWKAAILSALLRGVTFYISNLRSGPDRAAAAMVVEAVFVATSVSNRYGYVSRAAGFDGDGSTRGAPCRSHSSRGPGRASVILPRIRFNGFQLVCDATWIIAWRR
jgi:hypothetical protein